LTVMVLPAAAGAANWALLPPFPQMMLSVRAAFAYSGLPPTLFVYQEGVSLGYGTPVEPALGSHAAYSDKGLLIQILSRKLCPKARGVRVERKRSEVEVWANIFAVASNDTCLEEECLEIFP